MDVMEIQEQLDTNRRSVAFDSYDITIRQLYDMILEGTIDIAPEYQRHFVWDPKRQSTLIELTFRQFVFQSYELEITSKS